MAFCMKCGTQLPDNANFCNKCGTPTGTAGASPAAAASVPFKTLRTSDELNNPDLNYYLAYKIDFSETDAAKIQSAMAMKRNTFMTGTPVQRRLRELYDEAVRVMTDPVLRQEELAAAQRLKAADAPPIRDPKFAAYTGRMEQNLRMADKRDLYDLLGVPKSASVTVLQNAIPSVYASVSGKADAKSAAIQMLCGEAKMVFKDENSKKNYDDYLAAK